MSPCLRASVAVGGQARYSCEVPRKSILIVLVAIALSGCSPKEVDYTTKIAAIRAAKDENFKTDPDSPVPADKKATLIPLAYFPIDESYAVPASLEPAAERTRMQVPTSR